MNILVIGNGFDIAHGLKTSYKNFLLFIRTFSRCYQANIEHAVLSWSDKDDTSYVEWILDLLRESDRNEIYHEVVSELHKMIDNNLWIEHFNQVEIQEGWVDFEKEISRVVHAIDRASKDPKTLLDKNTGKFASTIEEYAYNILSLVDGCGVAIMGMTRISELKKRLLDDLNKATRALEIYLSYYVEDEQLRHGMGTIARLDVVSSLKIDRVLSFNYTDTYERLYGIPDSNIQYDYIHGKAKKGLNAYTCNLVLGIDEYLDLEDRDIRNDYIEFKKFYQRIFKRT